MSHMPFINVSTDIYWDDWENYQNGRPNPKYSKQVVEYGVEGLILGFINLGPNGACWGQTTGLDWALPLVKDIQNENKKVIISFGGPSDGDISSSFSVDKLVETYSKVIEMYNPYGLDFYFGFSFNCKNMALALKSVLSKYPDLVISLTTQATPNGLEKSGLENLKVFNEQGINFIVNGLTMDFYGGVEKDKMGEAIIQSVTAIKDQLKTIYTSLSDAQLYEKIAFTPMIGLNNDLSLFTIDDAIKTASFAKSNSIAFISSLNLNRDNPSRFTYVDTKSSSNPNQTESGEYTKTFVETK
ncbi:hypothetical protein ACTA71_011788 [Dictyostelium dimigraforme]